MISLSVAKDLASQALLFIAADPALTSALLEWSGMNADDLRASAGQPEFDQFLLEFLLQDDQRVLNFASTVSVKPESIIYAQELMSRSAT